LAFAAHAQEVPARGGRAYTPGTMRVEVDATNLSQRIFRIKQTIPVQAGPLTLLFPRGCRAAFAATGWTIAG
jgi:hypothetical protein